MDTIFALATARGRAGIAVIRISGPEAQDALLSLTASVPPRVASLREISSNGLKLDDALVLYFPGPKSFTGEDVVELHLHGSIAIVDAVLSALSTVEGLRHAEAGEFTRQALLNDKLDIAQVEGLADLIEAETEAQRRQAQRVLSGELGRFAESVRSRLIRAAALLEATIDFADEEVPTDVGPEVTELLASVIGDLEKEVSGSYVAERVKDGFEVAIVGSPNVGKSSLLNALAGRDAAITSEIAGTTRDVIEVRMDLKGLPVTVLDTAGIRESEDVVEALGIERARSRADAADLRVILLDEPRQHSQIIEPRDDDIVLVSKADMRIGDISAKTGAGIDALIDRITTTLETRASGVGVATRARHRVAMVAARLSLARALELLDDDAFLTELVAEELRNAARSLDTLLGRVGVEDLLDEVFSSFCIGK